LPQLKRNDSSIAALSLPDRAYLEAEIAAFCEPVGSLTGGQQSQLSVDEAQELVDIERWVQAGRLLQATPSAAVRQYRTTTALEIALNAGNHALVFLLRQ
jgi:hypothetical protein